MAFKETFSITGADLLKKIKELVEEGNVNKITIADKNGKEIISFPITIGVVGAILAPIFAAVGALAALLTECKITVERRVKTPGSDESKEEAGVSEEQNPLV